MVSVSFSRSSYVPPPATSPRRSRAPSEVERVKLRPDRPDGRDQAVDLGRGERRGVGNGPHAASLRRRAPLRPRVVGVADVRGGAVLYDAAPGDPDGPLAGLDDVREVVRDEEE